MTTKQIKIRSYNIKTNAVSISVAQMMTSLKNQLETPFKLAISRLRKINMDDDKSDVEMIGSYHFSTNQERFFASFFQMRHDSNSKTIAEDILNKEFVSQDDIKELGELSQYLLNRRFLFMFNSEHLVTTLPGTINVSVIESYLNWLLESVRGNTKLILDPVVTKVESLTPKMSEIKSVSINSNPLQSKRTANKTQDDKKIYDITREKLLSFFKEADLKDIMDNNLVSAELVIKFKKPKKKQMEELESNLSAMMKNSADLDNMSIELKNGKRIQGSEIEGKKFVTLNLDSDGVVPDSEIENAMENYLSEL